MKLAVFNGSPRGQGSNSSVLIQQFLKGYMSVEPADVPVINIAKRNKLAENVVTAGAAENIIIVFPLYTDCMPGIVLEFLEALSEKKADGSKKLGFIVHSGFPESVHSEWVERYLKKFSERTAYKYLGTIIKGGSEGIRLMPEKMMKKLFGRFNELGGHFAGTGGFSAGLIEELKKPRRLSAFGRLIYSLLGKIGLTNMYWNSNLKKNNAYKDRFAKPFKM
ncbi:MAG: NAD(P)H-dependent oxidoreductase [Spirochaetales bacterium]|nr:NAD(P)H-dependent oxidoreductase [Spirochaetales bacterium]